MAKRVTRPTFDEMIEEAKADVRAFLDEHADGEVVEGWDESERLWDSGEMQEMIDDGDFSDLPAAVRPRDERSGDD